MWNRRKPSHRQRFKLITRSSAYAFAQQVRQQVEALKGAIGDFLDEVDDVGAEDYWTMLFRKNGCVISSDITEDEQDDNRQWAVYVREDMAGFAWTLNMFRSTLLARATPGSSRPSTAAWSKSTT
jgi:hypothetical protein